MSESPRPSSEIHEFRLHASDPALADLRRRLRETRWPEPEPGSGAAQGVPLRYLQELCRYWAEEYDWRAREVELNRLPQFRTELDGLGIHFVHVRSTEPDALPLLLTHGWPGSVVEFCDVIPRLVDPRSHGGAARDAYHVVCPSLPGYGFSDKPRAPGCGVERIADLWAQLMARLGYDRYLAQGGDWGAFVTAELARRDPAHCAGIHLNMSVVPPDPATFDDLSPFEKAALASLQEYRAQGSGYARQQATRPQTLGYALVDSPAGLAAWILDKFISWMDCEGDPERVVSRDRLIDNLMFYWLPGTGASSARLYWESMASISTEPVEVPAGMSMFPRELFRVSQRWAEKLLPRLSYWNALDRGGHFAALEQPELFVSELRRCFGGMRP